MAMLGLGSSIGTLPEGVTADVLVVTSFDDLKAKASKVCMVEGAFFFLFTVPYDLYKELIVTIGKT